MRRTAVTATILAALLPLASACGDDEPAPTSGGQDSPETIEITFTGNTVTPNGETVELAQGQDVEFVVKADAAGELHVHSTPEQTLSYSAGTTTIQVDLDEPPGVVEVEAHDLDKLVVKLEIR